MWPLTEGRRIRKRRHAVADGARTWEIDEFLDRDLVLAEIELRSATEEVQLPHWVAAVLVREVTDEPAYTNARLASGDGGSPEETKKELDQKERGNHGGDRTRNGARASHEPRPRASRFSAVEPTIGEPPGA